jgi:HAD superfamily hydrolase (TIGR01549 family)
MPQAVIFDIDGTLVDSVDLHARAWQEALEKFGHSVPFATVRAQIGKGGDQLLPVFLNDTQLADYGTALEAYRSDLFKRKYLPKVRAFPEVRALFQRLHGQRKRIALASSAKRDELETYERIADIAGLVTVATSADDAEQSKPHPDIFAAALDRLGLGPAALIAVGDTPYDAQAAGKLGIATIGLLCGGWSEIALRAAGCVAIYCDPADLLAHSDSSPLAR